MKTNRGSTAPHVILSLGAAAALIIIAAALAVHYVAVRVPSDLAHEARDGTLDTAHRMAESFKSVFNFSPRITVNGTTVIEQANPVVELATVQQDVTAHYRWSQTWLGSTKTMELQGAFRAKAGFDLRDPFRVSVDNTRITASLPAPKILSLEMTDYKILVDENGWWNSINSHDRENAIAAMQTEARVKAQQSGLLENAKLKFREELFAALKGQNITVPMEVDFADESGVVSPGKK